MKIVFLSFIVAFPLIQNIGAQSDRFHERDYAESSMDDEEKDIVLESYERQKADFRTDADDSLFERVSKAYVRNLDRVLKKRTE